MTWTTIAVRAAVGLCLIGGLAGGAIWALQARYDRCERATLDRRFPTAGPAPSALLASQEDPVRARAKAERRQRDQDEAEYKAALAEDRPELDDLDDISRAATIRGEVVERRRLRAEQAKRDEAERWRREGQQVDQEARSCFWGRT